MPGARGHRVSRGPVAPWLGELRSAQMRLLNLGGVHREEEVGTHREEEAGVHGEQEVGT